MATYYQYQNPSEIGAAPTLDWGTVINNVQENLQKQEQQRYDNREADKKLTNDILTKANEITASSDPNFGAILQKTAEQIKNNTFARYELLKNNKISQSDYKIFNQNASSSIAQLDSFSKNWNNIYTSALDLRKKGLTTDLSNALQDALGGFGNFTDKKLIQGNDGFLNTATIDPKTGKVLDNSLGILPMQAMTNVKNFTDLRVNLQDAANKYAKDIKPFITVDMKGKIRTLEGIEQRKSYNSFLDNAFNGVAVNDNVIADILTTYGDYKIDLNLKDSDDASKKITSKQSNGTFVSDITPSMREEAKRIFEKQLLSQVKYEETPRAEFATSRGTGGGTTKPPKYTPAVSDISRLNYKGTDKLRGVALGVDGVIIPKGKGIEERVDALSYEGGKLKMKVTKISGTETDEVTTGDETGGGTVKVGEGKKNISENTRLLNNKENYNTMSIYIKQIPFPGQDRNFRSLEEAERYLKDEYNRQKAAGGVKSTTTGGFDPEAYYNSQKNKK
jgi:hypothetical protein